MRTITNVKKSKLQNIKDNVISFLVNNEDVSGNIFTRFIGLQGRKKKPEWGRHPNVHRIR